MDPVSSEMLDVAIEVIKMPLFEKNLLIKFTLFALEKNVLPEDHPLTAVKRYHKNRFSMLDSALVRHILCALADPHYPRFSLEIFFKFVLIDREKRKRKLHMAVEARQHWSMIRNHIILRSIGWYWVQLPSLGTTRDTDHQEAVDEFDNL